MNPPATTPALSLLRCAQAAKRNAIRLTAARPHHSLRGMWGSGMRTRMGCMVTDRREEMPACDMARLRTLLIHKSPGRRIPRSL
jgi:hypothetical protein